MGGPAGLALSALANVLIWQRAAYAGSCAPSATSLLEDTAADTTGRASALA